MDKIKKFRPNSHNRIFSKKKKKNEEHKKYKTQIKMIYEILKCMSIGQPPQQKGSAENPNNN